MPTESTLQFPALNLSPRVSAALGKIIDDRLKEIQTATDFFSAWQRAESSAELIGLIYYLGHLVPTMLGKIWSQDTMCRYEPEKISLPCSKEIYHQDAYELMSFLAVLSSWDDSPDRFPDWRDKGNRVQKALTTWLGNEAQALAAKDSKLLTEIKGNATNIWYKVLFNKPADYVPDYLCSNLKDKIGFLILNYFARYVGELDHERARDFPRIADSCWRIFTANYNDWKNQPEKLLTALLALGKTDQLHRLLRDHFKELIPAWVEFCHQLGELPENNWDENNPGAIVNSPQAQEHEKHHYESFLAYLCRLIRICYFK